MSKVQLGLSDMEEEEEEEEDKASNRWEQSQVLHRSPPSPTLISFLTLI